MKRIILAIIMILVCGVCFAATTRSELRKDGAGVKLQGCAPTIKNDATITGNSQTVSVDGANCWKIYVASDTKFRTMSTATKVGTLHTVPGGTWMTEVVSSYKFVNFTTAGATGTFRSDKP